MKKLFLALSFVTLSSGASAFNYKLYCGANRGKVGIAITSYKDRMYFQYTNQDGREEFPVYEGTVTKSSMVFIKIAEKELADIDDQVNVSWPVENCKIKESDPRIIECGGEARFDLPKDTQLKSYTFMTGMVREEMLSATYETFKIRWGVEGQDFHHHIAMPFDPQQCKVEYSK